MFKGMSLNAKMLLAPICLMLVLAVLGTIGYTSLSHTVSTFGRLADESVPNLTDSAEMFLTFRKIRVDLYTLGIEGISKADADQAVKNVLAGITQYEAANKAYSETTFLPGEKELYEKVDAAWKAFKATGEKVLALQASGTPEDRQKIVNIFFEDSPREGKIFTAALTELREFHVKNAKAWTAEAREIAARAELKIIFAILFGILVGFGLTIFTIKSVSGLIGSVTAVAVELTAGAEKVSGISANVSETSEKLSASAAQQAAALQETTSAVEESSAMVRKNAENAQRSADASQSSRANVEKGKKVVGEMIVSIEEIAASNQEIMKQIESSNKEMSDIVGVINEIGNKTKVINDIVFQTKLLSFNASVEAARAGEHGKGFAVVAEEVGNLAAMSGRSAKEITDLLETSTKRVQEIVANTKEKVEALIAKGSERLGSGITTAKNCDVVLDEIVTTVESVNSMVAEIASASREQSKGIAEINKAISELESAAQQNSATSHSAAASGEELTQQVRALHASIGSLNGLIRRGKEQSSAARIPPPSAKVIAFASPAKVKAITAPPVKAAPAPRAPKPKKAVGGVPSATDPGFSEV